MGIIDRDGALYFATGIDNSRLQSGKREAMGIIRTLAKEVTSFDVFAGIGTSAVTAFAAAAKSAYTFEKEFQKNMLEVSTISQQVQSDMKGFSDQVIAITQDIPIKAPEAAKALYGIVSAGYDGAESLRLLDVSARSAVGGLTQTETAADAITTVLNAYKKSVDEAESVSDQLFTTVRLGKTTFGELGASISQVAPIAASFGIGIDEVLSAVATLTKQGTPTAQAMTQIRAAIQGVSGVLGDAAFQGRTLQDALQLVSDKAGGSASKMKDLLGTDEGLAAALAMTGKNARSAANDLAELQKSAGATQDAFQRMQADVDNQMQLLSNNILAYLRPMGEEMVKQVTELSAALNEAFANGDIDRSIENITKVAKIAAGAFATYKLSILMTNAAMITHNRTAALTRMAMAKNTTVSALLTSALRKQAAAWLAASKAALANPYTWAAAAVVGLGYGIYKLATQATAAEKAVESHNKRVKEMGERYQEATDKTRELTDAIQNESTSNLEKVEAYQKLQQMYPKELASLKLEQFMLMSTTEANRMLTKAIEERKLAEQRQVVNDIESEMKSNQHRIDQIEKKSWTDTSVMEAIELRKLRKRNEQLKVEYDKAVQIVVEGLKSRHEAEVLANKTAVTENTVKPTSEQTDKEKKALEQEKQRQLKREREVTESMNDLINERNQLAIDLMKDGYEKRLAEIEAAYDKEIAAVLEKEQEWKDEQAGVLTNSQTDYISEALRQAADKRIKLIDQLNQQQSEADRNAMNEYLAEWGTYQEKREAIRQQYLQKMSEADTKGLRMSLQKEMEQALSELSFNEFQKSISWDKIFGNLGTINTATLKSLREQLQQYFDTHQGDTPDNLKLIRERLEELDREIMNSEKATPKLKRLIETFKEAKDTTQRGFLSKEQIDLIRSLSEDMDRITGVSSASMELAETLGVHLPDGIGKAVDGLSGFSSGLKEIASGNVIKGTIGMLTGLVNVFKGVGNIFSGIFGSSNREWETLNDQYDRLRDVWSDLIDLKKEYLSQSWGDEINSLTNEINKLYEAQQAMAKTVAESRLKYRKTGDHSVGYNMWNGRKQFDGYAWKDIASSISSQLGIVFDGMDDLISMTTEQYQWIMMNYPEYIAMLDEEFKASLEDIHQIGQSMENVIEQSKEQLTGISFDTLEDEFLSTLLDMDSSSQEFADNFTKYLQKSIIQGMYAQTYRDKLRAWYDSFAAKSGDGINVDEYKELQQQYSEIVESAIEERNRLKEIMGWATEETATEDTTSDNSLKGAYAKASQESIDLLAGQTGALRVSVEQIRIMGGAIHEQMSAIHELQIRGWDNVRAIRELSQQIRQLTEQVADNTSAINERMQTVQNYTKRSADALESTLNVKVKM